MQKSPQDRAIFDTLYAAEIGGIPLKEAFTELSFHLMFNTETFIRLNYFWRIRKPNSTLVQENKKYSVSTINIISGQKKGFEVNVSRNNLGDIQD
jgi:hypothetical protein